MCGIIGVTGNGPVVPRLIDSLKRLEYRGYDSAGVAAVVDGHHRDADLVVALDRGHERELARLGVPSGRRRLLRSFDPQVVASHEDLDIADPWYGGSDDFDTAWEQITAAVPGVVSWVEDRIDAR